MKKWTAALTAAVLAANYLLVVLAIIGALSAVIVMVRLAGICAEARSRRWSEP